MATEHKDITDPEIHEIKDASTAASGEIPIADGAGSHTWGKAGLDSIDLPTLYADIEDSLDDATIDIARYYWVPVIIEDISTPDKILIPVPDSVTFQSARLVLGGAITVGNAAISFKDGSGNSMGSAVTVTFASSAQGDSYTFTPSSNNVLTGPTYMSIETDGGSTDAQRLYAMLKFKKVVA